MAQGFHISAPLPPEDFTRWLADDTSRPGAPAKDALYAPPGRRSYHPDPRLLAQH